jgi:Drought induced 19 protein (Di19), zinc-binding
MCAVCKETYIDREELKEHLIVHKKYKCKTCRKLFYKYIYLLKHLTNAHRPSANLTCEICKAVFSKKYCLDQHMFLHADKKHFKCSFAECGKRFQHVNTMLTHERIHYKENRKKCPDCGKMVTRLSTHAATHRLDLRHSCVECDKSYATVYALRTHMQNKHSDTETGVICTVCELYFVGKKRMEFSNHMKTHQKAQADNVKLSARKVFAAVN